MRKNRVSSQIIRLLVITMLGSAAFAMGERVEQEPDQREPDQQQAEADRMEQNSGQTLGDSAQDAWIQGKLEATFAYNDELSPFAIDTEVENGVVRLEGQVESETAKNLAEQLSMNIEGVSRVENNLRVVPYGDDPQG